MIFTIQLEFDYEPSDLLLASESLQTCIDAVNNHQEDSYISDSLRFTAWNNDKMQAYSVITGHRGNGYGTSGDFNPVTYEEVMKNMVLNK